MFGLGRSNLHSFLCCRVTTTKCIPVSIKYKHDKYVANNYGNITKLRHTRQENYNTPHSCLNELSMRKME